jgi:hypothetical protein
VSQLHLVVSSIFLRGLQRALTPTVNEEFMYFTGVSVGGAHVPVARLTMTYRSVSAAGVDVEPLSNVRVLRLMERHGHRLLGTAHPHPGAGWRSVTPSDIDYRTHRRFELAGYELVGFIFSRDGWLRAFSWRQEFDVKVHGHGIEQHASDLFRITSLYRRPYGRPSTPLRDESTSLGIARGR